MLKNTFLYSFLMATTILSNSGIASLIEEQKEGNPQSCMTIVSSPEEQAAINKAQIKASEDIGAFLGACVPQMRHLMTWIKGSNAESSPSLTIQSMITSSTQDPESIIANFKQSVQDTINKLVQNGLYLTENHTAELNIKKMGDLSAHSILASLLARIYEIELSLEKAFPPFAPHTLELSPYYKLHKTFQKEKSSLEKLQQEREIYDFPQETSLSPKDPLAGLISELEKKFQNAQNGLKRLTVVLSTDVMQDFSSPEPEESSDLLISPRSNSSPQRSLPAEPLSPRTIGSPRIASQDQDSVISTSSTPGSVLKRSRSKSAMSSSTSSIASSSAPSSPNLPVKAKKIGRSESIGMQLIAPKALQQSPKFASRAESISSSDLEERSDSPNKKSKSGIFKSLKQSFTKKRNSSEESSSSPSGNTLSSSPPQGK